ncbi:Uncharacterised protein [Mycobacteroides abscessus subsp. abscessus]|nr:Uncharacterised protein [Mycobacteroides abscessus subsp. abscessus]
MAISDPRVRMAATMMISNEGRHSSTSIGRISSSSSQVRSVAAAATPIRKPTR